jgi:hypothetical protein
MDAGTDHYLVLPDPPPSRKRDAARPMFRITGCVRILAKSWTGAAIRLPQPRFVQTWLFALSRLQCGQIGFGNGTASSVGYRKSCHCTV